MTKKRSHSVLGSAVLLIFAACAGQALAQGFVLDPSASCSAAIEKKITELAVKRDDIDRISISPRYSDREGEGFRPLGFDAWVRFKSCPGALVIDLERDCSLRQAYTRGRCTLPGVKAY